MLSCKSGSNPGSAGLPGRYPGLARAHMRPRWRTACESRLDCQCRQLRASSCGIRSCGKIGSADYAGPAISIYCGNSTLVLVQHQTDSRFAPRWFAACDEAAWGSPYWRNRLSIGLLGLRKLPAEADVNPELMAATALARFAAMALLRGMNTAQVERIFRRRAAAMTVLYPRHDGYWRELWSEVFDYLPVRIKSKSPILRGWLRYPTDAHDEASYGGKQRCSGSRYRFPPVRDA